LLVTTQGGEAEIQKQACPKNEEFKEADCSGRRQKRGSVLQKGFSRKAGASTNQATLLIRIGHGRPGATKNGKRGVKGSGINCRVGGKNSQQKGCRLGAKEKDKKLDRAVPPSGSCGRDEEEAGNSSRDQHDRGEKTGGEGLGPI